MKGRDSDAVPGFGMTQKLKITKDDLWRCLYEWERESRNGETMSPELAASLPTETVADLSTDALWGALKAEVKPSWCFFRKK